MSDSANPKAVELPSAILDALPQLVFLKDPDGKFVWVNSAFCRFLGKERQEIIGRTDSDFKHAHEHILDFQTIDQRVLETGIPIVIPLEYAENAEGKPTALTTHKTPCKGGVLGISSTLDSSAGVGGLFNAIIDAAPDGIYVKDAESRYILVNREFLRLIGKKNSQEVIGRSLRDLGHEFGANAKQEDEQIIATGKSLVHRCRVSADAADGETTVLQSDKSPVKDSLGKVVGIMGFVKDVGQLQKIQSRVAWQDFTTSLAHQLKNRLFTLETNFRSLLEDLSSQQINSLTGILAAMDDTLTGLKEFMNQVGSRVMLEVRRLEEIDVSAAVENALGALPRTRTRIEKNIEPNQRAFGDAASLREVIIELATNSTKHIAERAKRAKPSYEGRIEVSVSSEVVEFPGSAYEEVVRIEIGDNGTGIDPSVKESLFRDRVSTLTTGWGVGLAEIYRTIVDRFHGTIVAMDEPGGGARFRIDLRKRSSFESCSEQARLD